MGLRDRFEKRERPIFVQTAQEEKPTEKPIQVIKIPLANLVDNPFQPRLNIDEDRLQELMNSIKENGLHTPIKVTRREGQYVIIYGHRRAEAHRRLGKEEIDAIYEQTFIKDNELRNIALIENIQREDLSILELAIALENAIITGQFSTQKDLAKSVGFSEAKVSACTNLLKLDKRIIKDLETDRTVKDVNAISALNKVENRETQWELYKKFKSGLFDRDGLLKEISAINSGLPKSNLQCEFSLNKSKFSLLYKPNKELSKKGKYAEYERFAKEKLENLQKELQEKEKELLK